MSYKFTKGPQVIGDLKAADDTQRDTLIDFGEDRIDFQTSGSVRMTIDNEGVTIPDNSGDYSLNITGAVIINSIGQNSGLTIIKDNSDGVYLRFIKSGDTVSQYSYIGYDVAENTYIHPGRAADFYINARTGVAGSGTTWPFRIYNSGKAKFEKNQGDAAASAVPLPDDVVFHVSGAIGGKGTEGVSTFGGDLVVSGTLYTEDSVQINGGFRGSILDITSNTVLSNDHFVVRCGQTGSMDLTLPPKNTSTGQILIIKDAQGNAGNINTTITINADGIDKIDATASSKEIDTAYGSLTLICDGINGWMILSHFH